MYIGTPTGVKAYGEIFKGASLTDSILSQLY